MEHDSPPPRPATWQWDLLAGLLPGLALTPMLVFQAAALSSRDAMRFFPLPLLLLLGLTLWRLRGAQLSQDSRRMWFAIGLMVLTAATYAYAVWVFSPWLAHLALLLGFIAWGLGRLGNQHWAGVVGLAGLIAVTLPLPWGWDAGFSSWLQSSAAWCTGKALDALAIPVLQTGSLVETRNLQLIADEVCGGLGSVYAFAAFAIAMGSLLHSSFVVTLKSLLLVPVWTLLGYFLTMFGIIVVQEFWDRDVSSGWDFRVLEIGISLLVLLLVWSSNRFLKRIYDPIPVADAEFGPLFSGMNKLLCWPQPDPFDDLEPDDDYEKQRFRKRREEALARQAEQQPFRWTQHPAAAWTVRVVSVLLVICAALPVSSLVKQGVGQLNFGRPSLAESQVEALANEESLPQTLTGDWEKRGFQFVQRNPRSRQGEFSLMWRYSKEQRLFDVSLDLPFLGWNDPASEMEKQGWEVEEAAIEWSEGWPWSESQLENELGGKAILFHALMTGTGAPYANLPATAQESSSDLGAAAAAEGNAGEDRSQLANAVTYQFQLFSESGVALSDDERKELQQLFVQLRPVVAGLLQAQSLP